MYYRYNQSGVIVRESDGACIPPDPNNMDYRGLMWALALKQIEIAPHVPEPETKREHEPTPADLAEALIKKGLLTAEEIAVAVEVKDPGEKA